MGCSQKLFTGKRKPEKKKRQEIAGAKIMNKHSTVLLAPTHNCLEMAQIESLHLAQQGLMSRRLRRSPDLIPQLVKHSLQFSERLHFI
jgi:hypothetical protein